MFNSAMFSHPVKSDAEHFNMNKRSESVAQKGAYAYRALRFPTTLPNLVPTTNTEHPTSPKTERREKKKDKYKHPSIPLNCFTGVGGTDAK